jgi:hypothetical protein
MRFCRVYVRLGDHRPEQRAVARIFHVEDDRLLPPVQPDEVRRLPVHRPVVPAREVAAGPLDLDNPRPQVGELPVANGAATACSSETTVRPASGR